MCASRSGGTRPPERAASQRAVHIVGTPSMTVVPVSAIVASVSAGSKRGTTATAPPVASVATRPVDWPSTCENGAAPSITSAGPNAERLGRVRGGGGDARRA